MRQHPVPTNRRLQTPADREQRDEGCSGAGCSAGQCHTQLQAVPWSVHLIVLDGQVDSAAFSCVGLGDLRSCVKVHSLPAIWYSAISAGWHQLMAMRPLWRHDRG